MAIMNVLAELHQEHDLKVLDYFSSFCSYLAHEFKSRFINPKRKGFHLFYQSNRFELIKAQSCLM